MTFLKLKFVFFRKVRYILLYKINQKVLSFNKKIKINFLKIHSEKILLYNIYKKKKKIFFINLFLNKKICQNCKKNYFIKKYFYINKN